MAEPVRVVTLVGWYQTDASGDFIDIGPLQTTDQLVAGPGDPTSTLTGRADFDSPDNNELPRITLGDTVLDGVENISGDPETVFAAAMRSRREAGTSQSSALTFARTSRFTPFGHQPKRCLSSSMNSG